MTAPSASFETSNTFYSKSLVQVTQYQSDSDSSSVLTYTTSKESKASHVHHHIPISVIEHEQLQNSVKKIQDMMRSKAEDSPIEELILIDTIQRLGLEFYFQDGIYGALEKHYAKFGCRGHVDAELYEVALSFRLLRQNGFKTHTDVFEGFKRNDGKFKQELRYDVKGLLSLFEASKVNMQGEDILDEAGEFSEQLLRASLISSGDSPKARLIEKMLRNPFHRRPARILNKSFLEDVKVFLDVFHDIVDLRDWTEEVQHLARIEFDMSQRSHRYELQKIAQWGRVLNLSKKLKFARLQPFKWYMWSLGTLPGPKMAEERIELAKTVSFVYIVDDIFDIYGTLEELSLFTEAVNRWEDADTERLPEYMKVCFKALTDMVNDASVIIRQRNGWDPKDYLRQSWIDLVNSFLIEAKWFSSGKLPTSEEYLKNGTLSAAIPLVLTHAFFLLGEKLDHERCGTSKNLPSIVASTATIVRLWNDVGNDKDDKREGKDGSFIDCYTEEHKPCSINEARRFANHIISDVWKCLNKELFSQVSPFTTKFNTACLNIARLVPIVYDPLESHHLRSLQKYLNMSLNESLQY